MTTPSTEPELPEAAMRLELSAPVPESAFTEVPGLRGIRVARIAHAGEQTLEVIAAVKDAVIPLRTCSGREQGRVLSGSLRFMREGEITALRPGDRWDIPGGEPQGPHVVLEPDTRVLVLRQGDAALG